MHTSTYRVDFDRLTVISIEPTGEEFDLNATGEPCTSRADLIDYIRDCYYFGAFDVETMRALIADCRE